MDINDYIQKQYGSFVGKTIKEIRVLSKEELDSLFWTPNHTEVPLVVIFNDGQAWIPSCDPEGNGPGFLISADLVDELD